MNSQVKSGFLLGVLAVLAVGIVPAHATLTISKKPTKDVTCASGVCTATAKNAVLNATDLANMLATSDVNVVPGKKAMDIDVATPLSWTSTQRLTLDAYTVITIEQPVSVTGSGALTLTTKDGGSSGSLSLSGKGDVMFWDLSSNFVLNGSTYTLVSDIATLAGDIASDMSGNFALAKSYSAKPDGTYKKPPIAEFAGKFEGLGNTISSLKIKVKSKAPHAPTTDPWLGEVGLFGVVDASGSIENVSITNANVSAGDLMNVGILVGGLSGTVTNSSSSGQVTVGNGIAGGVALEPDAGGLVGAMFNSAIVSNSNSSATVTGGGSSIAGGLVGGTYNGGTISDSYATGTVTVGDNILGTGTPAAGGLLGYIDGVGTIVPMVTRDYATGAVAGGINAASAGGLVAACGGGGTIQLSHASGTASVGPGLGSNFSQAGGLIGLNYSIDNAACTVDQSYATGAVVGGPTSFVGGLAGYTYGSVSNSYATGAVLATGAGFTALGGLAGYVDTPATISASYSTGTVGPVAGSWIGGFAGGDLGPLSSDYWDTTTSGITNLAQGCGNVANCSGVTGLSTAQLQAGLPSGFSSTLWAESAGINGGLPYLAALPPRGNTARVVPRATAVSRTSSSAGR